MDGGKPGTCFPDTKQMGGQFEVLQGAMAGKRSSASICRRLLRRLLVNLAGGLGPFNLFLLALSLLLVSLDSGAHDERLSTFHASSSLLSPPSCSFGRLGSITSTCRDAVFATFTA